ncbi:MAG: methanogenesis marker 16 metalloprotein [Candidatus Lokiarchaeota archaeon]|nr:methanogenesis marker 16 metalloprotein [Candidatus Lokiarchaeota archaeon]
MKKKRSIEEIRKKISDGSAVIMTAQELCQLTQSGKKISFDQVDVVTTATKGLMSGTSAVFSFRIGNPKEFVKVKTLFMNDIPCYVGPCPNETLGIVDLIIYATDKSFSDPNYGAGHLLRQLVEHKPVKIKATTIEGDIIEKTLTIDDIYFAKVLGIRHAFKNYNAFTNPSDEIVRSIFTVMGMGPNMSEVTICGTGVINPLENDPNFEIIGIGTPLLMNGALGYIIGSGTRSSKERPNLMTIASLFDMKPEFMGGFKTAMGPEVICTIAVAIPILNEKIFSNLKLTDDQVALNVVDIVGRDVLTTLDYGQVWNNKIDLVIKTKENFQELHCKDCEYKENCPAEKNCPTNAFSIKSGINRALCFNCGTCVWTCPEGAAVGKLGHIYWKEKKIPIKLRQSDRNGAIKLMNELKRRILSGEFPVCLPTSKPDIFTEKVEDAREHGN